MAVCNSSSSNLVFIFTSSTCKACFFFKAGALANRAAFSASSFIRKIELDVVAEEAAERQLTSLPADELALQFFLTAEATSETLSPGSMSSIFAAFVSFTLSIHCSVARTNSLIFDDLGSNHIH